MTFNLRRGGTAAGMVAVLLLMLAIAARTASADTLYPQPRGNAWTDDSQSYVSDPAGTHCEILTAIPDTLCNVENIHDATNGTPPGSLRTNFNLVAGALTLITGTGKFTQTFPFKVVNQPTGPLTFHLDRRVSQTGLINVSAGVSYKVELVDQASGARTTLISEGGLDESNAKNFSTQLRTISQSALVPGRQYHIEITSTAAPILAAAQVQEAINFDNLYLRAPDDSPNFRSKPDATTLPATDVTPDEATLNSSVNPLGTGSSLHYEIGTTTAYGTNVPAQDVLIGDDLSPVSPNGVRATNLSRCTTYHFRVVASNSFGTTFGNDQAFTTWCAPGVATLDATGISATSAFLNGRVVPNGPVSTYHYSLGTSAAYENGNTPERTAGAGFDPFEPLTVPVSGLKPQTTYHFRIVGSNALGSNAGNDVTFTTPPLTGPAGATGAPGTPGAPGAPGARGPQGSPGVSGSSTNTTITNDKGLLRIRASLVKVGTAGRRRGQVRLPIFCTKKTGRTCAGTVKVRTINRINPSVRRKKAKRRVTFLTFEYQLQQGKKGYAISDMSIEKLQLIEKIKSVAVQISVQVTDSGGNRQTIVRNGRLRAVRSP
jgi:hypothetical protein